MFWKTYAIKTFISLSISENYSNTQKKIISFFNFFQRPILTSLSSAENKIMEFKNIVLYSLSSILFDEINDMSYILTQLLSI